MTLPSPAATSRPSFWAIGLRVLGLALLLGFLLKRVDLDACRASWRGMDALATTITLGGFSLAMFVRVTKWGRQARAVGLQLRKGQLARRFLWGVLLGAVTPMRLGELTRLSALEVPEATRAETLALAGASLLLEKLLEVIVLGSLVAAGLALAMPASPVGALGLAGTALLGVLLLAPLTIPAPWMARLPGRLVDRLLQPALSARDRLSFSQRAELLALTYLAQACNMLAGLQVYRAFGDIDPAKFFYGMPLLTFSSAFPLTVSGVGLRELAAMELFGGGGYPASGAALAATLVFLGANVLPALALLPLELVARVTHARQRPSGLASNAANE